MNRRIRRRRSPERRAAPRCHETEHAADEAHPPGGVRDQINSVHGATRVTAMADARRSWRIPAARPRRLPAPRPSSRCAGSRRRRGCFSRSRPSLGRD